MKESTRHKWLIIIMNTNEVPQSQILANRNFIAGRPKAKFLFWVVLCVFVALSIIGILFVRLRLAQ